MDTDTRTSPDIAGGLATLRRQRRVILATTLVVAGAALVSALVAAPVYGAASEVAVEPVRFGAENVFASSNLVQQEVATQLRIATSEQVAARVREQLSADLTTAELLDRISAEQLGPTRVIRLVVRDSEADRAAELANTFAEAYLADRRQEVVDRVAAATEDLRSRADQVRQRIVELEQELAGSGGEGAGSAALARERESLLQQLGQISTQLTALEASGAVAQTGGEVIRRASAPSAPLSPDPLQRTALGALIGLVLGLALGWVREQLSFASPASSTDNEA